MPELPEVQTTVNSLNRYLKGEVITDFWFDAPKLIKYPPSNKVRNSLVGRKIISAERLAKNIFINLDNNETILIHLKMTGHLLLGQWKIGRVENKEIIIPLDRGALLDKKNGYIHILFTLKSGKMLAFSDLRKFGKLLVGPKDLLIKREKLDRLGKDALEITSIDLRNIVLGSKRPIKQVLMDQEKISGIGNIYSDDILWSAKIHPLRPANSLSDKEIAKIVEATKKILALSVSLGGTSISDYRDINGEFGHYGDYRLAYQREGELCSRCKTKFKKIKVGSRSATFCPYCQKI